MKNLCGINTPIGYQWLVERKIIGFEPFSQLQPWYFMKEKDCFFASERWANISDKKLLTFARRQDCDELACFIINNAGDIIGIALIQGWTKEGFHMIQEYPNFWSWFIHVVEDIAEWVDVVDC